MDRSLIHSHVILVHHLLAEVLQHTVPDESEAIDSELELGEAEVTSEGTS